MNVISVTVKLKLDLSFRNKLEKCCLYILVFIPCNTADIGANSRFSDNCKLRADKSKISLTV